MPLFPATMQSDRLRFERVHPDDTDVFEVYEAAGADVPGIEETTRYLTWDPHQHPADSRGFVEHAGEQFDEADAAHYVVRPSEGEEGAGEFAGTAGITAEWERRRATLGIWLGKPFWGRGYSGERAARFLRLAFERLDLELVAVEHATDNENSRRAIEKYVDRFGGRREGTFRNACVRQDGTVYDAVRYSIAREEWEAERSEASG